MMKRMKKVLAMFLCVTICFSMFPTWAFASKEDEDTTPEEYMLIDEYLGENEEPEKQEHPESIDFLNEELETLPEIEEEWEESGDEEESVKETEPADSIEEQDEESFPLEGLEIEDKEPSEEAEVEPEKSAEEEQEEVTIQSIDYSGDLGENLTWTLDDAGLLTISGTGWMGDFDASFEFTDAPWGTICESVITVIIEEGATEIGDNAFSGCSNLTSIKVPNSVKRIGDNAFSYCSALTSVKNASGVTQIGHNAFSDCSGLADDKGFVIINAILCGYWGGASAKIPEGVTQIGHNAFSYCSFLTSVEIPSSVTSIGDNAFSGCSSLTSVEIPSSVTSIGIGAFVSCSGLISVEIPSSITSIGHDAFSGCSSLKNVEIPSSITSIESYTFYGCSRLTSVKISSSVTSIGYLAFYACSALGEIEFNHTPADQLSISSKAFDMESEIIATVIKIPDPDNINPAICGYDWTGSKRTVNYVKGGSHSVDFSGVLSEGSGWTLNWRCYGSVAVEGDTTLDSTNLTLEIILTGSDASRQNITISGAPWLDEEFGLEKNDITSIIISGTAKNQILIPPETFIAYDGVKILTLDCINSIEPYAFADCINLERVDGFDEYLIAIGSGAFKNCPKLKSVSYQRSLEAVFPKCLVFIGDEAFMGTSLEEIYLMEEVSSIGNSAFKGCESDLIIHCYPYTYAASYSVNNKIKYELLEEESISNFEMKKDSWSFANIAQNFTISNYYISESDLDRLLLNCDNIQRRIVEYYQKRKWGGSCRGMAAAAVLVKMGLLLPSDFENGAGELYDVSSPEGKASESLINYYYLTQDLYNNLVDVREFRRLSVQTQLNRIEALAEGAMSGGAPFLFELGGHAVVGYGVKHGLYYKNGVLYDSKILIYDVNNPKNAWTMYYDPLQNTSLYYNQNSSEWYWPCYGWGNTNCSLWQATNEPTLLAPSPRGKELEFYTIYSNRQSSYDLEIDGQTYWIYPDINNGDIVGIVLSDGDSSPNDTIVTIPINASKYIITPSTGSSDFMITVEDALIGANCDSVSQISFHPDGSFTAADVSGSYDLTLLYNEGAYTTPWYETNIQGTGDGSISMSQTAEGILIEGTDHDSVTVTVTDVNGNEQQLIYKTDEDQVLVSSMLIDGEEVPVVLTDEDKDGTFEHLISAGTAVHLLKIDREYAILHTGESEGLILHCSVVPAELAEYVEWTVEPADEPSGSSIEVITVDEKTGEVTAMNPGTAYVVASVEMEGEKISARCRIDVVEDDGSETPIANDIGKTDENGVEVNGVQLTDTKATVELYRTDYPRIRILPVLTQNKLTAQAVTPELVDVPTLDNLGVAITGAVFEDDKNEGINEFFILRVADDRTLEIIPTDKAREYGAANDRTLKSSYKASIIVTVNGENFPVGPLTLTVKKTLPKISVKPVKFNSFLTTDTRPLDFGGVKMVKVEEDGTKTNPGWVQLSDDGGSIAYSGSTNSKVSGMLNLLVQPEGWSVKLPVTVSVSAASTAPKLTLKPTSLSLQPNGNDSVVTMATVAPVEFKNCEIKEDGVLEGAVVASSAVEVNITGNEIRVSPGSGIPTDGKAHTYKITLGLRYNDEVSAEAVLTVNLLAKKDPTLTLKTTGTIDLAVPGSPVTFVPTLKNVGGTVTYAVTAIKDAEGNDRQDLFTADEKDELTLTGNNELTEGRYTATVTAFYGENESVSKDIVFTVKESKSAAASVTLKATGSIDVLRPNSAVTLTPTVKNLYGYTLSPEDVTIEKTYDGATKQKVSEDATDLFSVSTEDGAYIITKKAAVSHLDKFTVTANVGGVAAKAVALSVKMGTAKIAQSTKAVTLLKTDRYSSAPVSLALSDASLGGIGEVVLISPGDKTTGRAYFTLERMGQGVYGIRFNENLLPADIANLKAQTVKLQVFLQGNETTDKPNATLSVKVNIL